MDLIREPREIEWEIKTLDMGSFKRCFSYHLDYFKNARGAKMQFF